MKILKKIVGRVVIVLVILLFLFWIILEVRDANSYDDSIPENSDVILRISVDDLGTSLITNALKHPSYYRRDSRKKDSIKVKLRKGMKIPANIFLYNLKDDPKVLYTTLTLKDSAIFRRFIQHKLKNIHLINEDAYTVLQTNTGISIIYNAQKAVIAFDYTRKKKHESAVALLNDFQPLIDKVRIKNIKKLKGDMLLFKDSENYATFNFEDGSIAIKATVLNTYLKFDKESKMYQKSEKAYAFMGVTGKPLLKNNSYLDIGNIQVPVDSLFANYGGAFTLQLQGNAVQKDTIISYEYDDNFEKIALKTIQEKLVPGIGIGLTKKSSQLDTLLKKYSIIVNNHLNTSVFPLYHLNVKDIENDQLIFSNNDTLFFNLYNSDNFLEVFLDFKAAALHNNLPFDYGALQELNLSGYYEEEHLKFNGSVSLTNPYIHSLYQLLK